MFFRILPFLMILIFQRKVSFRKMNNLFRNFLWGFVLKKELLPTSPSVIMLEPTNICNLKCKGCAYQIRGGRSASLARRAVCFKDYKKIIDEVKDSCLFLFLYMGGESFLNKEFLKMIRYASKNKIFTLVATNGSFKNIPNFGYKIINSGLDVLIFSISGTIQKYYQEFHRGGNLELVKKNIISVVRNKKGLTPRVMIRYLATPENRKDWKNVRLFARNLKVDNYEIRKIDGELVLMDKTIRVKHSKKSVLKLKNRYCFWLWLTTVIRANGDIIPCCFDYYGVPVLGNVFGDKTVKQIWQSEEYQRFRQAWLKDPNMECCLNCESKLGFQDSASEGMSKIFVKKAR